MKGSGNKLSLTIVPGARNSPAPEPRTLSAQRNSTSRLPSTSSPVPFADNDDECHVRALFSYDPASDAWAPCPEGAPCRARLAVCARRRAAPAVAPPLSPHAPLRHRRPRLFRGRRSQDCAQGRRLVAGGARAGARRPGPDSQRACGREVRGPRGTGAALRAHAPFLDAHVPFLDAHAPFLDAGAPTPSLRWTGARASARAASAD